MKLLKQVLILLMLTIIPTSVFSGTSGKIVGMVTDKSTGETLIGVNVVIEGTTFGSSTDIDGVFTIINVPPGTYIVLASYIGYADIKMSNVKINIDLTTQVEFKMQEASLELGEVITVIAERQLVTKDLTATTARVDADQIAVMPVTEISDVLALQAGYVDGHMRGGRSGEISYWIDGVPVTDAYDGSQVIEINTGMVEQLEMVSGAFNAEYGHAMSGIVNIITKEPTEKFGGSLNIYGGDFFSTHEFDRSASSHGDKDIFLNVNNFKPQNIRNFDATLFGQIFPKKLSYIANIRHIYFGGWQYGQRIYNPQNYAFQDSDGEFYPFWEEVGGKGDNEYVAMNWNEKLYLQGKLIYNITPLMKLAYNFIRDDVEYQDYDRAYKLNPDGNLKRFRTGNTHILKLSHTLTKNMFYDLSLSYFDKKYQHYVYKDFYNSHYIHPDLNSYVVDPYSFKTGGTNNQHFERNTKTALVKFDLGYQINKKHFIKTGIEYRQHDMFFYDKNVLSNGYDNIPYVVTQEPALRTQYYSEYNHKPYNFSAYIQDKMEFESLIMNLGVRLDYFSAQSSVSNTVIKNEETIDFEATDFYEATDKISISPRLGASFPITAKGIIHFSYGHFYQIPGMERLYQNPQYNLASTGNNLGIFGNADIDPEQTISAELGIQQELTDKLAIDATVYFRDIRNLAGSRNAIQELITNERYSRISNSDHGLVKGFIVSLKTRYGMGINYSMDYTFQIAKGTASDPENAFNALDSGRQPEILLTRLNWDQRHTLNGNLGYSAPSWSVSFIGTWGSGMPYTPRSLGADIAIIRDNSQTKPSTFNLDMRLSKTLKISNMDMTLFVRVLNMFDNLNEVNVHDDSGRAGYTTRLAEAEATNPNEHVNSLEEWYNNITYYSEPRRIEFGLNYKF